VGTYGYLSDHKGINLPGVELSTPSLTRKDMEDLQRGLQVGIDFVAGSCPCLVHPLKRRSIPFVVHAR